MNRLILRWSWRDLRSHWVAVIAIALVVAIGTGVFAGLGSTATWRTESNDISFAATRIHDLRAELTPGTFVEEGTLLAVARSIPDTDAITGAVERLVVDNQVDASTDDETILVRARLVGMSFDDRETGDPTTIDDVWMRDGTEPADDAAPSAVLEAKFADTRDLAEQGTITLAGGREVAYTGLGVGPEEFYVSDPNGGVFAQGEYAVVYAPLPLAQELISRPGQVNDLVVTLADGIDRDAIEAQLRTAMDAAPDLSATVTTTDDVVAYSILYDDIENDQQVWNMISALILLAAALAAFNLVTRIVESQRREIGIGMALGVSRGRLAVRPLLVGIQIGLLGTLAGVGIGILVGSLMKGLMESLVPLPTWRTPFQFGIYAQAAVLGIGIPLVAAALPVWRAVRVEPIQAIRTGHLTARTSRLTDWTNRLRLPGSSLTHLPIRNILRNPRRTILTAVGVGAAITALVAVLGMLDSFERSIQRGADEITRGDPDRLLVSLDGFYATDSPEVAAITSEPTVGRVDIAFQGVATAITADPDDEFALVIELVDLDQALWTPSIIDGDATDSGLILAGKAADDLGLRIGDPVLLRLAVRTAQGFAQVETELPLAATHPNPIRTFAYGDLSLAEQLGFGDRTNLLHVYPSEEATRGELQRAAFGLPGVASTQAVARISESFDEALEQFVGILIIGAGFVLLLALLIAFNSSRITVEERRREHATMRAFGLPVRSVMGVVVRESVIVGVVATVIGLGAGTLVLSWMLNSLAEQTLPDFGISTYLAPSTFLIALGVGVVAVAVAPLFLIRRVRRMDIPDTLRVME